MKELKEQVASFNIAVNNLREGSSKQERERLIRENEAGFQRYKKQLEKISKDANRTLDDITSFLNKYGGENGWKKIKAAINIEEIPGLRNRQMINYLAILELNTSLSAGNGARTQIDVQLILRVVSATYSLIATARSTRNTPTSPGREGNIPVDRKDVEGTLTDWGLTEAFVTENQSNIQNITAIETRKRGAQNEAARSENTATQSQRTGVTVQKENRVPVTILVDDSEQRRELTLISMSWILRPSLTLERCWGDVQGASQTSY